MAIKLIVKSLDVVSEPQEYLLEDILISVGRSHGCTVELNHSEVSRRHFIIKFEDDEYALIDECSSHGTWLNDVRLEPGKIYPLAHAQTIHIPGFVIDVINDHQQPRPEKTTVMARKLIGKLFEDLSMQEETPFLYDSARQRAFIFQEGSSSFILGRAEHVDFVIADEHLNKEHLSLIRDIDGISAVVINEASLAVNGEAISDAIILCHGDVLTLGSTQLVFFEREDPELHEKISQSISHEHPTEAQDEEVPVVTTPRRHIVRYLDVIFSLLFFVATGTSLWFVLKMIKH